MLTEILQVTFAYTDISQRRGTLHKIRVSFYITLFPVPHTNIFCMYSTPWCMSEVYIKRRWAVQHSAIKVKKLVKLECTPLQYWDFIAFVRVCFTSPFIQCYWYLVVANWGVRVAFSYTFSFETSKVSNSGAVKLSTVWHMNIHPHVHVCVFCVLMYPVYIVNTYAEMKSWWQ